MSDELCIHIPPRVSVYRELKLQLLLGRRRVYTTSGCSLFQRVFCDLFFFCMPQISYFVTLQPMDMRRLNCSRTQVWQEEFLIHNQHTSSFKTKKVKYFLAYFCTVKGNVLTVLSVRFLQALLPGFIDSSMQGLKDIIFASFNALV